MGLMYFPRYIKREGRDYFYMTLRHLLPGPPVPPPGQGGEAVPWTVKGLAQHGFPYALATARVKLASGTSVQIVKVDPRMVTPFDTRARQQVASGAATGAAAADRAPPVVAALVVSPAAQGEAEAAQGLSIWSTPDAFSVADEPLLPAAVRLVTGKSPESLAQAKAAAGVQQDAGMLVYAQTVGDAGPEPVAVATDELVSLLARVGVVDPLVLSEPLSLALGGDTDLSGQATRLQGDGVRVDLYRVPGPGARRIFPDTAVVPLKEWYPLQARRIRYFKKKKADKDEDKAGGTDP
jgi:hypothetical protein